jgi:CheY-like chemotaxis protein
MYQFEDRRLPLALGRGELILVVDDEFAVRMATEKMLEAYGYETLLARDGVEAVKLYAQNRHMIRAVVTDLMMHNADGVSVISALHEIDPAVKIIAVSGLDPAERINRTVQAGTVQFLRKPYTSERLLAALAEIMKES